MDSDSKLLMIIEKIADVSERQSRMDEKLSRVQDDVKGIKDEDKKQNELLDTHIKGTIANTERLNLEILARQEFEKRVDTLEKLPKAIATIYKVVLYLGAPVGLVYEIGRMLHKW